MWLGGVVPTVTRAMELFTQTEVLDGANKYKCERCACLVPARKQFTLHAAPRRSFEMLSTVDAEAAQARVFLRAVPVAMVASNSR